MAQTDAAGPIDEGSHMDGSFEPLVRTVWSEVLGISSEAIGAEDNIVQFGGSIELTKIIVRLQDALAMELPLERLLDDPTVRAMATLIGEQRAAKSS